MGNVPIETAEQAEIRRRLEQNTRDSRAQQRILAPPAEVEHVDPEVDDVPEEVEPEPLSADADADPGRGRPRPVRARTIDLRRVPEREKRRLRLQTPAEDYWRPRVRADCATFDRPCPYVACRHHLLLDVGDVATSLKVNFPDLIDDRVYEGPELEDGRFWTETNEGRVFEGPFIEEMQATCALDVAEQGDRVHEEIGPYMNLTRERVRQVEEQILEKLKANKMAKELVELLGRSTHAKMVNAARGSASGAEEAEDE